MFKYLRTTFKREDGAVSIDWVVLTAAVVAMGIAAGIAVRPAVQSTTELVGPAAQKVSIGTSF